MPKSQPSIEDRIVNEFGMYYSVDEMPLTNAEFRSEMSQRAAGSGRRLVSMFADQAPQLSARLREIAGDRSHPLIHEIVRSSQTDWFGSDDDLHTLQELLGAIADAVDASAADASR